MTSITFLHFIWYTVQYMSKLLTYDQIRIRMDLFYKIHIRQMQISRLRHIPSSGKL